MMDKDDHLEMAENEHEDALLEKLLHLKKYEAPESSRVNRNKQNIMRRVRQTEPKNWSLERLMEVHIPWFFAEPRYGIALLFVVFAGLQFWGVNSGQQGPQAGMYADSVESNTANISTVAVSTNQMIYPKLPNQMKFFPTPAQDESVMFVGQKMREP